VKTKRVEVLFDPKEYDALERAARERGRPVGSMIRDAVATYVAGPTGAAKRRAIDALAAMDGPTGSPAEIKKTITDSRLKGIMKSLETN
jgi:hypothetical protein